MTAKPAATKIAAMADPKIADRKPIKVDLEAGDHYWCSCGGSSNQPYCDGSHAGSEFKPMQFTAEEAGEAYLCMCKHTKNPPYCDGTHAKLDDKGGGGSAPAATGSTPEEPTLAYIHALARDGLEKTGHHGPVEAMGVPRPTLPQWDDIQVLTGQLATKPLMEDAEVGTDLVIGPGAKQPLRLEIPLFVSDMSFGALSEEAKTALARGAEMAPARGSARAKAACCPRSRQENSRYFYELASAPLRLFRKEHGQAKLPGVSL